MSDKNVNLGTTAILVGGAIGLVLVVAYTIVLTAWLSFVLSAIYGWFIYPFTFVNIPFYVFVGISFIVTVVKPYRKKESEEEGKEAYKMIGLWFLRTAVTLGVAYITKFIVF